ncbi:MAG: class D sortase, partial [Bryobacteraceae bacterium]
MVRGEKATITGYVIEKQQQITSAVRARFGIADSTERSLPSPAQPAPPTVLEKNALIGRLTIPRLNLNTTVREGTSANTLALAAGHIPGTALPGSSGNVAVAGHRDTLFRGLAEIRKDDLIWFETSRGRYEYQVASIEIVGPQDVRVLRASSLSELTLVTCYPFDYTGSAPERFVVKARQVHASPSQRTFREPVQEARGPEPASEPARPARSTDLPAGAATFHIGKRRSRQVAPGIT